MRTACSTCGTKDALEDAVIQVPPPSQRVLPWERELEDGTIVSTIKEDSSGEGVLSLTLGTLGKLVLRTVTGVARKMHLL